MNRSQLKADARSAIADVQPKAWRVTLLLLLLTNGVSSLLSFVSPDILNVSLSGGPSASLGSLAAVGLFISLLMSLFGFVLSFGYSAWSLDCWRRRECGYASLIEGFSMVGGVLLMNLLVLMYTFFWVLALMSFVSIFTVISPMLAIIIGLPASILGAFLISARYILVPFALVDNPDAGAFAAVRRGVSIARPNLMDLVKLSLSFFGWLLTSMLISYFVSLFAATILYGASPTMSATYAMNALPSLIGMLATIPLMLWLTPYMQVTFAGAYHQLAVGSSELPPL